MEPRETSQVELMGLRLESLREVEFVEHVFELLQGARAPSILTANLDILRRYATDPEARAIYDRSDLCIADGMPLVWAAAVAGCPLPERIAGSTLSVRLLQGCWQRGLGVVLLGGAEGSAETAAERARADYAGLKVHGDSTVRFSMPPTPAELQTVYDDIAKLHASVILVGLGSPKQEAVIEGLRSLGCRALMVGVGGTFSFLAGDVRRAPRLLQGLGLEWAHRLAQEPGRLAERYLVHDLPFFLTLMNHAFRRRWTGQ